MILWGGYVSMSGAGDGCGDSWPLCGELLAETGSQSPGDTLVEFTHRATSGLALVAVVAMAIWSRRRFPAGHRARAWAAASLLFMVVESLLGAALVIFQWVDMNISLARAVVQPVHLTNTYLLMGSLAFAAWTAGPIGTRRGPAHPDHWLVAGALVALVALSALGTTASLASTVFPAESFLDGVRSDFTRNTHYLIRLRIWHPVLALGFGGYLFWLGRRLAARSSGAPIAFHLVTGVYAADLAVGGLDAVLLAPIGLQMAHLLLAHVLWLSLLWLWLALAPNPSDSSPASLVATTPLYPNGAAS